MLDGYDNSLSPSSSLGLCLSFKLVFLCSSSLILVGEWNEIIHCGRAQYECGKVCIRVGPPLWVELTEGQIQISPSITSAIMCAINALVSKAHGPSFLVTHV